MLEIIQEVVNSPDQLSVSLTIIMSSIFLFVLSRVGYDYISYKAHNFDQTAKKLPKDKFNFWLQLKEALKGIKDGVIWGPILAILQVIIDKS
jgi:hypothetical protein